MKHKIEVWVSANAITMFFCFLLLIGIWIATLVNGVVGVIAR